MRDHFSLTPLPNDSTGGSVLKMIQGTLILSLIALLVIWTTLLYFSLRSVDENTRRAIIALTMVVVVNAVRGLAIELFTRSS